ncbi:MAG: cation-translocating P-type ATPase [Spirochaetia bacterium]|nr:cation-translocating P-type ATPase [Spirochaetia bacterium]MBQ3712523.1 cation-translocating P-type ATPase [Spirochaetia bacterium]
MYVMNKKTLILSISAVSLILSFFHIPHPRIDLSWVAILLCGIPIIKEAGEALIKEFDITADVLVAMAIIASVCIGEFFAAGEVALIMALGEELEEFTVSKARSGIEKLVSMTPTSARVLAGDMEQMIDAQEVQVGAILKVLPGETVPVDGVILSGQTSIDQSVMTGESLPVDKGVGDDVSSGTINRFGSFTMRSTRIGADSSIQRMIQLVKSADAGKAKIVGIADRWAFWIVIIAFASAIITAIVTGQIIRGVTILVVFCPCALVLATPTAIMAAIGNVSRYGFLVKEGDALERLSSVKKVALDKTGTLTYGVPSVSAVVSFDSQTTEKELFSIAASVESCSEHPLGKAVVASYTKQYPEPLSAVSGFVMVPGKGVEAEVYGEKVLVGTSSFLAENRIELPDSLFAQADDYHKEGCTVIYIAKGGKISGFIALSDTVRKESTTLVESFKKLSLEPVLLTGDNYSTAKAVSEKLAIDEFYANCLPQDKVARIEQYQNESKPVCMIGDGINDAPVLKKADVGIAMGGEGSDIAASAADIVLINDNISTFEHIIVVSRKMMRIIKVNILVSLTINFVAVLLAVTGYLDPVVGALVHNGGSFLVIANSAYLYYNK